MLVDVFVTVSDIVENSLIVEVVERTLIDVLVVVLVVVVEEVVRRVEVSDIVLVSEILITTVDTV